MVSNTETDTAISSPSSADARRVIGDHMMVTPIATSDTLNRAWGCHVSFKLEMLHTTGSFKERGAFYKLHSLTAEERACGVIAASAGNHAQALAFHAGKLGVPCTIVMPENAPLIKVRNTTNHGAKVILHGCGYDDALAHARELADKNKQTFVHGFDDPWIIAGQGTCGLELLDQCPKLDCVIVPIGGGGLIAGIASAIKELRPEVRIIGVQSKAVPSAQAALDNGHPVKVPAAVTIADGIAVRRLGEICFQAIHKYVDEIVEVTESEIAQAVLLMLEQEKAVVEGAGAVGVAAMLAGKIDNISGKNVAMVLSGGNIDVSRLALIIAKGLVKDGRLARLQLTVPDVPGTLAKVLALVAKCRANIMEVEHQRAFSQAPVGHTNINLTIETRGPDHMAEIIESLKKADVTVETLK